MLFVRAAANNRDLTLCNGLNSICVGGYQSQAVTFALQNTEIDPNTGQSTGRPSLQSATEMRNPQAFDVAVSSSWKNPPPPTGSGLERPYEVSRPNISALAIDVWGPKAGDTMDDPLQTNYPTWRWKEFQGNSFAAPAVAGLLALYKDYCGPTHSNDSRQLRAELFASGYRGIGIEERYPANSRIENRTNPWMSGQPDVCKGPPFNIPNAPTTAGYFRFPTADSRFDCDYGQGVGPANATALRYLCPQPSGSGGSGGPAQTDKDGVQGVYGEFAPSFGPDPRDTLVLARGPDTMTDGRGTPLAFSPLKDALGVEDEGEGLAELTAIYGMVPKRLSSAPGAAQVVERFLSGPYPQNEPIRVTLVYDSCPNGGVHDNAVINNFDIALCGIRADNMARECIAISESLDDNVEGFDVRLPRDYQSLSALLIFNSPLNACPEKSGSIPAVASENIGWLVVTWP